MSYEDLVKRQRELLAKAELVLLNDFVKFQEIMNEFNRLGDEYLSERKKQC